ncbi:hypothetical protein F1D05_09575 [Kribbella qitaiheensis]|uniref:Uncharacterized protein n=1 Tax=Kribbella qitaiheensis TaxID=1544730 RepID=A0A7G6WVS4_9ACTN|nr:hypothetical protein [Kribbella qitaiheensis]QNE18089.1 hypothetical protein F1D05_09575 [Kribbella qitaiheensis]
MSILTGPKHAVGRKERPKKPDELLSSVVRETAAPAAVEVLRGNEAFAFPSGTAWVVLVLAVESIGGLSRRHVRDEARGSIIELIENDSISTLATRDLLDAQTFGIIPTPGTLERMDEYSLLTGAEYTWAVAYLHGGQDLRVDLVTATTFAQAQAISQGRIGLEDAIGAAAWAQHSGEPTPDDEVVQLADDEDDPPYDQDPAFGLGSDDQPDFSVIVDDEVPDPQGLDEAGTSDDLLDDRSEIEDEAETTDGEDHADEHFSRPAGDLVKAPAANLAEVRGILARRFLSDDIDLQVTLDEFTTSFGLGPLRVQIEEPAGSTSWLGDQVAQLVRQANAQLSKLHADGQTTLQTHFVTLMSLHAEQVMREVSIDLDGSIYRELTTGAKAEYRQELAVKEETCRQARAEIQHSFEEAITRIGQQAAAQAESQYRERHRARIQREQVDVVAAIEAKIENDYAYTQQEILGLRRKDAQRKMAIGMTRVFEVLAERQEENLAAEQALLVRLTDEIQRVVDENRKNDISRAHVLATEQSTLDRIGLLERENTEEIGRLRAAHADKLQRAEDEFEHARQSAIEQLQARDEEWLHSLNLEREKTTSQTNRVSDLLSQMDHMAESFNKQYAARITELQADRQAYIYDLERSNEMQSRSNNALIAMAAILALLMLAGGFVIGAALT